MYKKWIKNFFILFITIFGMVVFSFFYYANGKIDPFYVRFTTPEQNSLILGTSRAAQGLDPAVFEKADIKYEGKLFNFAFTGLHSPYGEVYFKAIQKKLDKNTKNGLFILEVSPSGIKFNSDYNPNDDPEMYKEHDLMLSRTTFFNLNPNFEYLFRNYEDPLYYIYLYQFRNTQTFLHDNGWLEVNIPLSSNDREEKINTKIASYKRSFPSYKYSAHRINSLKKIISYLNVYGDVFLVRLPTSVPMLELEQIYFPEFDQIMEDLARKETAQYIDLSSLSSQYLTNDGNHLNKVYSKELSKVLANMLENQIYSLSDFIDI